MNPVVELYQKVHETLPADPVATPAGESHFRAVAPYMNAVEPRHLAMEPPSTSRRSSSDSADSAHLKSWPLILYQSNFSSTTAP